PFVLLFLFFTDTAPTEIYTLSLHDALPILIGLIGVGSMPPVHRIHPVGGPGPSSLPPWCRWSSSEPGWPVSPPRGGWSPTGTRWSCWRRATGSAVGSRGRRWRTALTSSSAGSGSARGTTGCGHWSPNWDWRRSGPTTTRAG